jgi:thiamine-phosphate diphosphorylase
MLAGGAPTERVATGVRVSEELGVRALSATLHERIGPAVTILINEPWDAAWPSNIGLHLRERDTVPDWAAADSACPSLVGRSVHSPEGAADSSGVDYVLAGHVYPSASKPGKPPLGLEGLARIVAVAPCPVIAIGGITSERVAEVLRAGAYGIAVTGAIAEAADPYLATKELRAAVESVLPIGSST